MTNNTLHLTRRQFTAGSLALGTAAAFTPLSPGPTLAGEAKKIAIGKDIEITVLSDGYLTLPMTFISPDAPAQERAAALKAAGQSGDTYRSPINVTLIKTPKDLIIVDVGSGAHFMASAGKLPGNLADNGIDPQAVTKVVYTHAHPDHIWGTVDDFDELQFPNAAYYMSAPERDFWMADDVLSKLPEDRQSFAVGAQRNIMLIEERLAPIAPGDDLSPGISVVDTKGHTPGHISIAAAYGAEKLIVLGDCLTHSVISFAHPDWPTTSDFDKDQAIATRQSLLAECATEGSQIIGYHLPGAGHGRVVKSGAAYAFEPA